MRFMALSIGFVLFLITPNAADSQALTPPAPSALAYADLADLSVGAPVAAHLRIRRASPLRENEATGVAPGHRRFLIEADLMALIRAPGDLSPRVSYLVDLPNDARGRPARVERRSEHLILASTVPGRPGELRLVAPDAQLPFSPATADRIRGIVREAVAANAPPRITGVGRAFHVPGTLAGESETQIFLQTADQRPISLIVLRRPGSLPRWAAALGELVDESAVAPAPQSLLWYRLACGLPQTLPPGALSDADPQQARAIQADYRVVLQGLGACGRTRRLPLPRP